MSNDGASSEAGVVRHRPTLTATTFAVAVFVMLCDWLKATVLMPYVEDLMATLLNKPLGDASLDVTVSVFVSLHAFCQFLFQYMWGIVSDRIGRKRTLLIGLGGAVLAPLLLGTATTVEQAFAARAIDSFFCGNPSTLSAYMGELVDTRSEARGFSYLTITATLAITVGPLIGGNLVRPATKWPSVFAGTVFDKFPFLLPNLAYVVLVGHAFLLVALTVEETLPARFRRPICQRAPRGQAQPLAEALAVDNEDNPTTCRAGGSVEEGRQQGQSVGDLLWRLPALRWSVAVVCLTQAYFQAWQQLNTLLLSMPLSKHGFGLKPRELAALYMQSAVGLLAQTIIYPKLCKKYGYVTVYVAGAMLMAVPSFMYPVYLCMADPKSFGAWRYLPLALQLLVGQAGAALLIPTSYVFLNREADPEIKGRVNGLTATIASLLEGGWPPVCAAVLQLLSKHGIPWIFRYAVVFQNAVVVAIAAAIATRFLSERAMLLEVQATGVELPSEVSEATDAQTT